jgi:hypothetical protein
MTLTISTENFYLGVIAFLTIVQIFQWRSIYKSKTEIDSIWRQIHLLTINIAAEILKLKKEPDAEEKTQ